MGHSDLGEVVVPGGDPLPDVVFEGLDGGVDAAADQFVGEQAEPAETWFIQDEPVGVKWTWKRGRRSSQVLISGVLWWGSCRAMPISA